MKKNFSIILSILTLTAALSIIPAQLTYADSEAQTFRVTVNNPNSVRVKINNPADKQQFSENPLEVSFSCINISSATVTVTNKTTSQTETRTYAPASNNEVATEVFDLATLGGYSEYIINVSGTKDGILAPVEDTSSFTYTPTPIKDITIDPSGTNDPIVNFEESSIYSAVDHVEFQLYSQPENKPMFNPAISVPRSELENGKYTLPFNEKEIPTGDYKVSVSAYTSNDALIYETFSDLFRYTAPIRVPDTGVFLKEIGMSGTSFALILTAVFITLGIAFFIIVKNKKEDDKKKND